MSANVSTIPLPHGTASIVRWRSVGFSLRKKLLWQRVFCTVTSPTWKPDKAFICRNVTLSLYVALFGCLGWREDAVSRWVIVRCSGTATWRHAVPVPFSVCPAAFRWLRDFNTVIIHIIWILIYLELNALSACPALNEVSWCCRSTSCICFTYLLPF